MLFLDRLLFLLLQIEKFHLCDFCLCLACFPFSAETTESELCRVFSAYGNVKSTKIIVDRAGVSKGYGFVTFDTPAVIDSLMVSCEVIGLGDEFGSYVTVV